MNIKQAYIWVLRAVSALIIVSSAYLVVCLDANETREPWEFVPVESK